MHGSKQGLQEELFLEPLSVGGKRLGRGRRTYMWLGGQRLVEVAMVVGVGVRGVHVGGSRC